MLGHWLSVCVAKERVNHQSTSHLHHKPRLFQGQTLDLWDKGDVASVSGKNAINANMVPTRGLQSAPLEKHTRITESRLGINNSTKGTEPEDTDRSLPWPLLLLLQGIHSQKITAPWRNDVAVNVNVKNESNHIMNRPPARL